MNEMKEAARVAEQLHLAYDGDAWYGPPLRPLLADLTAAQAAARPLPGVHSIWELVLHLAGWTEAIRRRLSTGRAEQPPEGDWPPAGPSGAAPDEAAWQRALLLLDERHRALVEDVLEIDDSRLLAPIPTLTSNNEPGPPVTVYATLHGLVQHNTYHTGQIAILKRAARAVAT